MKRNILLAFVFTTLVIGAGAQNKSVWTAEYEHTVYKGVDASIKKTVSDDAQRKKLVDYVVMRFKKELPMGLQSIPSDSLYKLSLKIGADYASMNPGALKTAGARKVVWSPEVESIIRRAMLEEAKREGLNLGNKFCDCAIEKLKKIYPDTLSSPIPEDVNIKIATECAAEMKNETKQNR